MSPNDLRHVYTRFLLPLLLFASALWLRLHFFSGYLLCDDVEFFQLTNIIYTGGLDFQGVLQYRFMVWLPHLIFFKLLGVSETSFSLPIWLFSSSLCVIAYFLLRFWRYSPTAAFLAAAVVASAPFEILIGTVVSNDITLEWLMALALAVFVVWRRRPTAAGFALAWLFWLGFYTKLWVVYWLPLLGIYYLVELWRNREWKGPCAFSVGSLVLHAAAACFWKWKMGMFFPFLTAHSATYPVPAKELYNLFGQYPQLLFQGSEYGTTLFGWLPYLLPALLMAKWAIRQAIRFHFPLRQDASWDRRDTLLVAFYGTFFLLLNFFPNAFRFDQYYSMPRIFRYLAPLSWPMALHAAKILCDLSRGFRHPFRRYAFGGTAFLLLFFFNVRQTQEATRPGVLFRANLNLAIEDLNRLCPPKILVESWQSFFLQNLYLQGSCAQKAVYPVIGIYQAAEYEEWLNRNLSSLPQGTVILSGIGSCIHYSCHACGYRLAHFNRPLSAGWKLFKEYGVLTFLPRPEPIRLWIWEGLGKSAETAPPEKEGGEPLLIPGFRGGAQEAFDLGMAAFDKADYLPARAYYAYILKNMPDSPPVEDALYFYAVTFWREANLEKTVSEFENLLKRFPKGRQAPGAYFHIGMAYKSMGRTEEARRNFQTVVRDFPEDVNTGNLSREMLQQLPSKPLWERLFRR